MVNGELLDRAKGILDGLKTLRKDRRRFVGDLRACADSRRCGGRATASWERWNEVLLVMQRPFRRPCSVHHRSIFIVAPSRSSSADFATSSPEAVDLGRRGGDACGEEPDGMWWSWMGR